MRTEVGQEELDLGARESEQCKLVFGNLAGRVDIDVIFVVAFEQAHLLQAQQRIEREQQLFVERRLVRHDCVAALFLKVMGVHLEGAEALCKLWKARNAYASLNRANPSRRNCCKWLHPQKHVTISLWMCVCLP